MKRTRKIGAALLIASLFHAAVALAESATASGEVKKIDAGGNKIAIRHGPIKAFNMETPMTMVYRPKDPAMLKGVKVGDKIKFEIDHDNNGYTITKIQKQK